jgi:4-carboxymuconolactone decarboxylase
MRKQRVGEREPGQVTGKEGKSESFRRGMAVRKAVLGSDYVERTMKDAGDFMMPLQEVITEWAWGLNWAQDQLTSRERSLVTLALMVALNRSAELRIHLRGSLSGVLSQDDIQALLLHCAPYCGIPAALDAFAIARELLSEKDGVDG